MYPYLLLFHSLVRWLVVGSVLVALFRGFRGWLGQKPFTGFDNTLRHTTATVAHVQLMIGFLLYFKSPLVAYFHSSTLPDGQVGEAGFFGWIHSSLMTLAIVLLTIGSALAKRQESDQAKFKTMTLWFLLGLLIIFIAIPWPFSPWVQRPYIR